MITTLGLIYACKNDRGMDEFLIIQKRSVTNEPMEDLKHQNIQTKLEKKWANLRGTVDKDCHGCRF